MGFASLRTWLPVVFACSFSVLCAGAAHALEDESASAVEAGDSTDSDPLGTSRDVRRRGNRAGVASQMQIDEISDKTDQLFARYTAALSQLESIRIYNSQMEKLLRSQDEELVSLQDQLERVDVVGRSVTPLMLQMIEALDAFVEIDIPFLLEERTKRVNELNALMTRADVNRAEKYRRIMEAYQIENEYGRTIEAYRGSVVREGREITVDFLRFGRIALVYQTLDGSEAGAWNRRTHDWEAVDSSYRSAIRDGLRIARKQLAPDLIALPLLEAVEGGGES